MTPCPEARQRPTSIFASPSSGERNSRTSLLLPTPASPTTVTSAGRPSRQTPSKVVRRNASSWARPTSGVVTAGATSRSSLHEPGHKRLGVSVQRERLADRAEFEVRADGARSPIGDDDRSRLRDLLEARGDVDGAARDVDIASCHARSKHVARAQADADCQRLRRVTGCVEAAKALEHAPRCAHGSDGVVLVHGRDTEDGHHRPADELLDRAAFGLDLPRHRGEVVADQGAEILRVPLLRPCGRADVGEQDGHELQHLLRLPERRGRRRRGRELEARVVAQDLQLELLQRRPRLQAELLDQRPAPSLKRVQRVGLPAAAIQRQHQLTAQPLPEHVLGDHRLQLRHQLEMAAARQIGVDPILQRRQPQLLQTRDLALRQRLALQIGQRLPPPQRQRITQTGRAITGIPARTRPLHQRLKPRHIDLIRRRPQQIPRRPRPDPLSPQQLAQRRHMPMQRVLRTTRRILTPQRLDQLRARHHLTTTQHQQRQQRTLLRTRRGHITPAIENPQRTKQLEAHVTPILPRPCRDRQGRAESARRQPRVRGA